MKREERPKGASLVIPTHICSFIAFSDGAKKYRENPYWLFLFSGIEINEASPLS